MLDGAPKSVSLVSLVFGRCGSVENMSHISLTVKMHLPNGWPDQKITVLRAFKGCDSASIRIGSSKERLSATIR